MKLSEVNEQEKADYNRFVMENEAGSFLQSWEWGQWQEQLSRQVFRYWILGNAGERIASIQLIKMPLPFGLSYLYAPYGPILDLRFKIEDLKILKHALQSKFPGC